MASVSSSSVVNQSGLFDWRVAFNLDILNAEKVKSISSVIIKEI